jgi:hypothetical protein
LLFCAVLLLPVEEACALLEGVGRLVLLLALLGIDVVSRGFLFEMVFALNFRLQRRLLLALAQALIVNLEHVHSSSESLFAYI